VSAPRIIVCGGRDYGDLSRVRKVLSEFPQGTVVVHGGAPGADSIAEAVASEIGLSTEVHAARWDLHGRRAGPMRNAAMAARGADLCIAFPGGKGTADMVRRARAHGIPVKHVQT
jgi:predicted Rossmann-fold nucleotide-binding protein